MNRNLYKILKRLCIIFYPQSNPDIYLIPYFNIIKKYIKHHGIISTIKIFKTMRLHITRFLCGQPLLNNDIGIGIDKTGWPKALLFLKPLVDENPRLLLTILLVTRAFTLSNKEWDKIQPNFNSITDESSCKITIPAGVINKFVNDFNLKAGKYALDFSKSNVYLSQKAGPQGPATLTALDNIQHLQPEEVDNLMNITDESGKDWLVSQINYALDKYITSRDSISNYTGKISFVKDPEAKLRLIAISDYYTQLFLKPINDTLFNLIKNLPCDRTFTQDPFHNWSENEQSFWSLDLSSATDRFPLELQKRLLCRIFNSNKVAQSWSNILSQKRFFIDDQHDFVSYKTGQPMGTYSSWISFTLTHHLIVYYCAYINDIHNFKDYIILGDDIVIKNNIIAKSYINVIKRLGVEISMHKTHISNDTYEFAKRWIRLGKEISGIPLSGIISNFENPFIVFTILYDFFKIKKNTYLSKYSLIKSVYLLFKGFKYFYFAKNRRTKKTVMKHKFLNISFDTLKRLEAFSISLDIVFDYYSYEKLRKVFHNYYHEYYPIPSPGVALSEFERILGYGMKSLVNNSLFRSLSLSNDVIDKYKTKYDNLLYLANEPIIIGIINYVDSLNYTIQEWDYDLKSVYQCSKDIMSLDIDSIFDKNRRIINPILNIGKMFFKGINLIHDEYENINNTSVINSLNTHVELHRQVEASLQISQLLDIVNGLYYKNKLNLLFDKRNHIIIEKW